MDHLARASTAGIGAPTLVAAGTVLAARLGIPGKSLLARFQQEPELSVIPFTDQHWPVAVDAYLRFGNGRHPAALSLGGCLTYAVSQVAGEPLLCVRSRLCADRPPAGPALTPSGVTDRGLERYRVARPAGNA